MYRRRFIEVDGIRTHYLEAGEGRPVLLLHSGEFGASAELSWELNIGPLAERYRVVAPDWLGYGETDKLYDFGGGQARMMRHMRRFIEIMGLEESDVVGNSMGGSLLSRHIAADPNDYRFRSLTLIASGGFSPDNEHRRAMMDYDCTLEAMGAMLGAMFVDPKWTEDSAFVQRRFEASIRPGAWETIAAARFKNPLVPPRAMFGRPDETAYEDIVIPTLVIGGAQDKLRLSGYAEELAARMPNAEVRVFDRCGHCPHIERADDVNALLLDFFARLDASEGGGGPALGAPAPPSGALAKQAGT